MPRILAIAVFAFGLFLEKGMAQDALSMSVASDILVPVSGYSDLYNAGFGGNIQLRYRVEPALQVGVTTGFFSWAVKDGRGLADQKGIPLRGLVSFAFARPVYIVAEAGGFIGWLDGFGTSSTDFNYAFGFGIESGLSKDGDIRFDAAVRYEGVARDAVPMNNVVLRIGVTFTLIQ